MEEDADRLMYLAGGGIAALLLGMALVPLRDFTTASNLTFPFMALTIAVAGFGGGRAAVVTALVSALSLDFFLTRPYLRLTIAGKHDIIAFLGLAACGLVAAGCGSLQRRRTVAQHDARDHLDLLHAALRRLVTAGPADQVLARILEETQAALPLSAVVARDDAGRVLAASGAGRDVPIPDQEIRLDLLLPRDVSARFLRPGGLPLPTDGGRLPLMFGNRRVGWLDVWGNGAPADNGDRRALSDIACLVSVWLAGGASASKTP